MNKQRNKSLCFIRSQGTTIITGVNLGYANNFYNLHDLVNSITTVTDGVKKRLQSGTIKIRAYTVGSISTDGFNMCPVIVQTAGTFTDTVNIAENVIAQLLNASIDDVFGSDRIGTPRGSKIVPGDGTLAGSLQAIETTVQLSPKVLQLLNKEQESKRLQDLYFAVVGTSASNMTINLLVDITLFYIEDKQSVIIR